MKIEQLSSLNQTQLEELKVLCAVLSDHCTISASQLEETLRNSYLYVLEDEGKIVGMATLCLYHAPSGRKGSIEDVVILPEYQGRGLGRKLMEYVLESAKCHAPLTVYLTSRPQRKVANILYRNLGFTQKDTNVYKIEL